MVDLGQSLVPRVLVMDDDAEIIYSDGLTSARPDLFGDHETLAAQIQR